MTHEELLAKIDNVGHATEYGHTIETARVVNQLSALRAVVELHKPFDFTWGGEPLTSCKCGEIYPCSTIETISKTII